MKWRWLSIIGFAAAVGVSSLLPAAPAPADVWEAPARAARKANPIPADEKSLAAGKAVYEKECRSCHGDTGVGNGPSAKDLTKTPGDLTTAKFWQQTDGAIFWKIDNGNPPMPATDQTLTDEQRWNVVNYLHTFAPKKP